MKSMLQRSHGAGQVDMIGGHNTDEVDRVVVGGAALALPLHHFLIIRIGPVGAYVIGLACLARARRVLTERSSDQFDVTIQLRCHAMNRPDKRTRTAPNHPHPKTSALLRHPYLS